MTLGRGGRRSGRGGDEWLQKLANNVELASSIASPTSLLSSCSVDRQHMPLNMCRNIILSFLNTGTFVFFFGF